MFSQKPSALSDRAGRFSACGGKVQREPLLSLEMKRGHVLSPRSCPALCSGRQLLHPYSCTSACIAQPLFFKQAVISRKMGWRSAPAAVRKERYCQKSGCMLKFSGINPLGICRESLMIKIGTRWDGLTHPSEFLHCIAAAAPTLHGFVLPERNGDTLPQISWQTSREPS